MKKWVLIVGIIFLIILIFTGIIIYKKISTGKAIDYGAVDIGGKLGGATTTNAFAEVKTNPFDSGKNG
jgi:hypothetical protein